MAKDGTARDLAARLARDGVHRVLVAGGDGTCHHVIQALVGTRTALGVIPLGTSNDLARRLQVPLDLDRALATIADARTAHIDLLNLGDHHVATVGGFGVAAHVAAHCIRLKAHRWLRRPAQALGGGVYALAAAYRIVRHGAQPTRCTTYADRGQPTTQLVSATLVGTVARFGGGLRLVHGGRVRPGTFCALVVTAATRMALLSMLLRLKTGRSSAGRARLYLDLTRFTLHSQTLFGAFGDGEWLGLCHRAVVQAEPGALRALVPASYPGDAAAVRATAWPRQETA